MIAAPGFTGPGDDRRPAFRDLDEAEDEAHEGGVGELASVVAGHV